MYGGLDPLLLVQNRNWEVPNSFFLKVFLVNLCVLQSVKLEKIPLIFWEVSKQKFWMLHLKKESELDLHMHSFSCNFCFLYVNVAIFRAMHADVCLILHGSSNQQQFLNHSINFLKREHKQCGELFWQRFTAFNSMVSSMELAFIL